MAQAIRMPLMSDTMTEGKIIQWNKKVGDKVKSDDALAEVETDKATMDVVGYEEGTLLYIGVEAGKSAKINDIIAIVGKEGEDFQSILDEEKGSDKAPEAGKNEEEQKAVAEGDQKQKENKPADVTASKEEKIENKETGNDKGNGGASVELPKDAKVIRMPLMSDTMTEGKIIQWNKKVGDKVKADDSLAEVETDKATMDVVGYEEGTLLYIGVEAGNAAKINDIIAIVGNEGTDVSAWVESQKNGGGDSAAPEGKKESGGEETKQAPKGEKETAKDTGDAQPKSENTTEGGRIKASPLAKRLAADKGIDIAQVSGSGDGGRIIKKDVDNYVPAAAPAKEEGKKPAEAARPVQPFAAAGEEGYEDIPNSQMRKTIARR